MKVGILALQGDYKLHKNALKKIDIQCIYVRTYKDLLKTDCLILPGGESTTISLFLKKYDLVKSLKDYSKDNSLFGVCAGSIIMSMNSNDERVVNIKIINMETKRNSWGRQIDSFSDEIDLVTKIFNKKKYNGTFIRAPKFVNIDKSCEILATYKGSPVLVRNHRHLVSSFHPELDNDLLLYKYYMKMVYGKKI